MTHQKQKFVQTLVFAAVMLAGLQVLVFVRNLDRVFLFVRASVYLYAYIFLMSVLIYDLHFKNPGALSRARERHMGIEKILRRTWKVWFSALQDRFRHLLHWEFFRHYQNYLVLPALIYWATVGVIYMNFLTNRRPLQLTFALLSAAALVVNFWYLKEVFHRKSEKVDREIINALTAVKLYASFLVYAAVLGLGNWYCLEPVYVGLGILLMTFWLMYQALFQYDAIKPRSLLLALAVSAAQAVFGYYIFLQWGLGQYFSGAVLLLAWYNFFWNVVHHYVEREPFNKRVFFELVVITVVVSLMMLGITNFKARILNAC